LEIAAMSKVRSLENELDVNRMNCKSGSLSANDLERLKNFYERTIAPVLHKYPLRPFFNGDYSFERMQYHKGDSVQSDKPEDSVQSDKAKPKAKSNPQPDGEQAPKRKRGRPRKVVSDIAPVAGEPSADSGSEDSEVGEEFPEPRAQPMRTAKTKPVSYRESYQADHSDEEDFDVNGALEEVNGPRRGKRGRTGEWPGAIPAIYFSDMAPAVIGDVPVSQDEQADIQFGDYQGDNGLLDGVDHDASGLQSVQPYVQPDVQPVVSVHPSRDFSAVCSKLVSFITSPGNYGPALDDIMHTVIQHFKNDASPVAPDAMELAQNPQLSAVHTASFIEDMIMRSLRVNGTNDERWGVVASVLESEGDLIGADLASWISDARAKAFDFEFTMVDYLSLAGLLASHLVIHLDPKHASIRDDGRLITQCKTIAEASIARLKAWTWKLCVFAKHVSDKTGNAKLFHDVSQFDVQPLRGRQMQPELLKAEIVDFMDKFGQRESSIVDFGAFFETAHGILWQMQHTEKKLDILECTKEWLSIMPQTRVTQQLGVSHHNTADHSKLIAKLKPVGIFTRIRTP